MVMTSKIFRIKWVTGNISNHRIYLDCLCSMRLGSALKKYKFKLSINNREHMTQETSLYYEEEDTASRISFLFIM